MDPLGHYWFYFLLLVSLLLLLLCHQTNATTGGASCNYFHGSWVYDESYPLYDPSTCPFISDEFNCLKNGRPDLMYLKYRWQPQGCDLARFDGKDFMKRFKGKTIMFVGDSLSRNQWTSLLCIIYATFPHVRFNDTYQKDISTVTFLDYDIKVSLDRTVFLVDLVREKIGTVLKLDSIEGGNKWRGVDALIFNTWHWWNRRGPSQPWDYIQIGNEVKKDMDRMVAFETALNTWAKWVDTNIDPSKSIVFFQGVSPSHYNGTDWNEPNVKTCKGQQKPIFGSTYKGGSLPALDVQRKVISKIKKPVIFLDVTTLSQLRKDGHPSIFGLPGRMDCSHWCLAGVPDTWNEIFYNFISLKGI